MVRRKCSAISISGDSECQLNITTQIFHCFNKVVPPKKLHHMQVSKGQEHAHAAALFLTPLFCLLCDRPCEHVTIAISKSNLILHINLSK